MPDPNLQEPDERFRSGRKASIAYGDAFLINISPIEQPYPGAWNLKVILPQQLWDPSRNYIRFFPTAAVNQESRQILISGWLEKKDAFTQTDLLESEEDQIQQLIYQIKTLLPISYREGLANRLVTLFSDAKEEEGFTVVGIAVGSLRNFYNFFQLHTNLKYPTISLTPENNIYASWRSEQKQLFSVLFLPNGDTRFVIFKPNDLHPERQIRISGTATTDILMATAAPYGVWDWISE